MACANCFTGGTHSGNPQGVVIELHGYPTYITPPPHSSSASSTSKSKAAILFLPDFFSHKLLNNKLLADRYAAATGFTVYFPDIVRNGGVDPSYIAVFEPLMNAQTPWWRKVWLFVQVVPLVPMMVFGAPAKAMPEVVRYARAVRREQVVEGGKLGVAGFCWGGFGAVKLAGERLEGEGGGRVVDAIFTGHPSALDTPGDLVKAVQEKVPVSVAVAEIDPQFDPAKAEATEAAMREKGIVSGNTGVAYEFEVFQGAHHGFCVRLKDEEDKETAEGAEKQAIEWFQRYLA
jgi:dienelactone hydrolase